MVEKAEAREKERIRTEERKVHAAPSHTVFSVKANVHCKTLLLEAKSHV